MPSVSRTGSPDLVIVSNRGPVSFREDGGELVAQRGAGGLISTLGPAAAEHNALWIAAAMTDADRRATAGGVLDAEGFRLRLLDIDPATYEAFYDDVANATLWYLHHGLFDLPRQPRFDRRWWQAWAAYQQVNAAFADAVAADAPTNAIVLVQDYHLTLLGGHLAKARPDLQTVHFHHTPFCHPADLRLLPDSVAVTLLDGLSGHTTCGFHSGRWAARFEACREEYGIETPIRTFVAPAAADHDDVAKVAASEDAARELADLESQVGERRLIVRVDRIELSKNLIRGFEAYDELLGRYPEWRERVVFGAFVYPSREGLADYQVYREECEALVEAINARWATDSWTPILLDTADVFPRSVPALKRFDVLLVNPICDGLNLVAKEGAAVNERDGVVVLSREAGAWDELGDASVSINPFDVSGTADALHQALTMPAALAYHAGRVNWVLLMTGAAMLFVTAEDS